MFRRTLATTLVFTTTWISIWTVSPTWADGSSEKLLTYEQTMERFDEFMLLIEELRSHLDRSQFDLEALLEKLDYDPSRISDFVKESVAFEQYPGVLRGAKGTLHSKAGNSMDQSLLLATLLKDAGFEARIARVRLTPTQAAQLLNEIRPRHGSPEIGDLVAIRETFAKLSQLSGVPLEETEAQLSGLNQQLAVEEDPAFQSVTRHQGQLKEVLKDQGLTAPDSGEMTKIRLEARDYFYVEFKDPSTARWTEIHPAFSDEPTFSGTLKPEEYLVGQVPESLLHRVRFSVKNLRKFGDKEIEDTVIADWERPAANLIGSPIEFMNVPNTLLASADYESLDEAFAATSFFLPFVNWSVPTTAQPFDPSGQPIDQFAAQNMAAGLIQTVGGKFGSAAGLLAGEGTETTLLSLLSQTIEYTLISPTGEEESHARTIDLAPQTSLPLGYSGDQDANKIELAKRLFHRWVFMVSVGQIPEALIFDRVLEKLIRNREVLRAVVESRLDSSIDPTEVASQQELDKDWIGLLFLYNSFDRILSAFEDASVYRPRPSLVVYEETTAFNEGGEIVIDIVANSRRALAREDGRLAVRRDINMSVGIWESLQEGIFLDGGRQVAWTAPSHIEESLRQGVELVSVGSETDIQKLEGVGETTQEAMRQDLDRGYLLVAPTRAIESQPELYGWWRVSPDTGETLGRGLEGKGSTATEWLQFLGVAVVVAFSICLYIQGGYNTGGHMTGGERMKVCLGWAIPVGGFTMAFFAWLAGLATGVAGMVGALAAILYKIVF